MYEFVDRPVDSLCNSGRFLLWAMRGWTRAAERGHCPPRAIAGSFAGMGVLTALPDFHMTMVLINRDSLEKIAIAPLEYPGIVEHEAVLISLWRDCANADADRARATLAFLVDEDTVGPISGAMTAAAAGLVAAGFDLSELTAQPVKEIGIK